MENSDNSNLPIRRLRDLAAQYVERSRQRELETDRRTVREAIGLALAIEAALPALPILCRGALIPIIRGLERFGADADTVNIQRVLALDGQGALYEMPLGAPQLRAERSTLDVARLLGPGAATTLATELTNLLRRRMPADVAALSRATLRALREDRLYVVP